MEFCSITGDYRYIYIEIISLKVYLTTIFNIKGAVQIFSFSQDQATAINGNEPIYRNCFLKKYISISDIYLFIKCRLIKNSIGMLLPRAKTFEIYFPSDLRIIFIVKCTRCPELTSWLATPPTYVYLRVRIKTLREVIVDSDPSTSTATTVSIGSTCSLRRYATATCQSFCFNPDGPSTPSPMKTTTTSISSNASIKL
ncbi:hypothetical protein DV711_07005 [Motiliproteus coralliicola]|uniref:Uncharacterized protein n=1 Tax=Motiliproteus coralliicola TaxID=2283196 RepID=A0A369WLK7_9GAMM|nr:hypothetical protein DV711_07005 [Motiliproteus coralliicola]